MAQRLEFETSHELKRVFVREMDTWQRSSRLGLRELSLRCGVSPSYLAHIGRYGRIPSKPVLILLALNFGMRDPGEIFRAAKLQDTWPFESSLGLAPLSTDSPGFLSLKVNLEGLVDALKGALLPRSHPHSLQELLGGRPLRIGLNITQSWLFERRSDSSIDLHRGVLPTLCLKLANALKVSIETLPVAFDRYVERLFRGEIDLFGPLMLGANCPSQIRFSIPVNKLGLSALMRQRMTAGLPLLEPPQSLQDLVDRPYRFAVLKDSRAHLFALTVLGRSEDSLITCSSDEEGVERVLLKGISRAAHIFLSNSMLANSQAAQHPEDLLPLFTTPGMELEASDNGFALRPDWGDYVGSINNGLTSVLLEREMSEALTSMQLRTLDCHVRTPHVGRP